MAIVQRMRNTTKTDCVDAVEFKGVTWSVVVFRDDAVMTSVHEKVKTVTRIVLVL